MKRDRDIESLFQKHMAKKLATELEEKVQEQERIIEEDVNPSLVASSVLSKSIEVEYVLPPIPPPTEDVLPPRSPIYDINHLSHDPGKRFPFASYPFNAQDAIKRSYILKGPFQPVGTYRQGYLLLVCPTREARDYP
jgi:hypothetical protein